MNTKNSRLYTKVYKGLGIARRYPVDFKRVDRL